MKIRAKQEGELTLVRVLLDHPMETGRRRDETTGKLVPAHFITELWIEHNGRLIVKGELSAAVAKDPYFSVRFRGGRPGDRVRVRWLDNLGLEDGLETVIGGEGQHPE